MMNSKTYETGIIGNCAFMAHVKRDTNISWLCWPRFDSSFVSGSLLDDVKGGEFSILPISKEHTSKQYYIENMNVLRRSEGHTSKLKSLMRLSNAVFVLQKKQIKEI